MPANFTATVTDNNPTITAAAECVTISIATNNLEGPSLTLNKMHHLYSVDMEVTHA